LFRTFDAARYTAEQIPNARFVGYRTGGHLWVGHDQDVATDIAEFLRNRGAPTAQSQPPLRLLRMLLPGPRVHDRVTAWGDYR